MLVFGGRLFVEGASALARIWGVSERVVGLSVVAVGTSLPELLTTLVAARQGHSDISVGNVVGSNIFNVLFCLGIAGALRPLSVDPRGLSVDLLVMLGLTVAAVQFLRSARTLSRWEAAGLLGAYGAYMAWLGLRVA
jgi:cation:H+ antiporter